MRLTRRGLVAGAASCMTVPARSLAAPSPPAMAAVDTVRVRMVLEAGAIDIALFVRQAPLSAGDFLRYVSARSYDGGALTRVVRADNDHGVTHIDVVQGGVRPNATKLPPVPHETTRQTGLRHLDGTISLPRDAVGTASGAEFFICIGRQPSLDFGGGRNKDGQGFAAFGRVVSGMDVVRAVWRMDASGPSPDAYTAGQILARPVKILSVTRIRNAGSP